MVDGTKKNEFPPLMFRPTQIYFQEKHYNEVVFVDMKSGDGSYEPLIGYIVLEQSQAAIDMLGHRLIHVKRMGLK
jgi:hypothetical protein